MTASAEGQTAPKGRPPALTVQANIVFLYYRDVPAAQRFYEDVIGLTLTVDQGFAKIYQVSPTSFIGLVDETQGLHRASEAKAVAPASFSTRTPAPSFTRAATDSGNRQTRRSGAASFNIPMFIARICLCYTVCR